MRKSNRILWCVAVLTLAAVGIGQHDCPEQIFKPIPADIDVNMIAIDAIEHRPLYLGRLSAIAGSQMMLVGRVCSPDPNESVRAWITPQDPNVGQDENGIPLVQDGILLDLDPNGFYNYPLSYPMPGRYGVTVTALNGSGGQRSGTWVVDARERTRPTLCGGLP